MALTINCCLKPSPSPSPSSSTRPTIKPTWLTPKDQNDWRKKCVATMACVIISSTIAMTDDQDFATAMEIRPTLGSGTGAVRWSDKRSCPAWRQNLLENIVPENLPRPLNSRRPNRVSTHKTGAVDIGGRLIGFDKTCFSL